MWWKRPKTKFLCCWCTTSKCNGKSIDMDHNGFCESFHGTCGSTLGQQWYLWYCLKEFCSDICGQALEPDTKTSHCCISTLIEHKDKIWSHWSLKNSCLGMPCFCFRHCMTKWKENIQAESPSQDKTFLFLLEEPFFIGFRGQKFEFWLYQSQILLFLWWLIPYGIQFQLECSSL